MKVDQEVRVASLKRAPEARQKLAGGNPDSSGAAPGSGPTNTSALKGRKKIHEYKVERDKFAGSEGPFTPPADWTERTRSHHSTSAGGAAEVSRGQSRFIGSSPLDHAHYYLCPEGA